jgi:hypothetical protein
MNGAFRVVTTPSFEREFRKLSRGNAKLLDAFQDLIGVLSEDPHGRTGIHPIRKLAGLNPGEGHPPIPRLRVQARTQTISSTTVNIGLYTRKFPVIVHKRYVYIL